MSSDLAKRVTEKTLIERRREIYENKVIDYGNKEEMRSTLFGYLRLLDEKGVSLNAYETLNFFDMCLKHNADPFDNEIFVVPYYNPDTKQFIQTPTLNYQVIIRNAQTDPNYGGFAVERHIFDKDGNVLPKEKMWVKVTAKYLKKDVEPLERLFLFVEHAKRKKDGSYTGQWETMPAYMLEKVAVKNTIQLAFKGKQSIQGLLTPEDLSGYDSDTLSQMSTEKQIEVLNSSQELDVLEENIEPKQENEVIEVSELLNA